MKANSTLTLFLALVLVSCNTVDFGDTDANNNGPSKPYPTGMLASAIMDFATVGDIQPLLNVQYLSQVTYTSQMLYSEVPVNWQPYYEYILNNLTVLINYNSDPVNSNPVVATQGPENQVGIAKILKAIVMKRVTDTWGDAPYSKAFLGGEEITPAYDAQEILYKSLIQELKEGRDILDNSKTVPSGDILYNGDVSRWKKLANSVIMQMAITLSKRYPAVGDYAATEFSNALADANGIIDEISEEAWFQYMDLNGFRNPRTGTGPLNFLTREFTDALNGNLTAYNATSNSTFDSRLKVYADDYTLPGVPYGYENGNGAGAASVSKANYRNSINPLPLMTVSYVALNRAHAAALGWTTEDVATMLSEGIQMSYATLDEHFGTSISGDAASYLAARISNASTFGNIRVIAEEKWVSLFGMGFDAWTEWRLTGYPALKPATDYLNDGQIPRRYSYPSEESALNEDNYKIGVSTLTPADDSNTSRVWWDKN